MNDRLIRWLEDPSFKGEIGASLLVNGGHWRSLGAEFHQADDGSGETPGLAIGSAETQIGTLEFGVLDYGQEVSYLLVPSSEQRAAMTQAILEALETAGMLSLKSDVLDDMSGPTEEPRLDNWMQNIEGMVVDAMAAAASPRPLYVPTATLRKMTYPEHEELVGEIELTGKPRGYRNSAFEEAANRGSGERMVLTGVIRRHSDKFALIRPDTGGRDVFVQIRDDLGVERPGSKVAPDGSIELIDGTRISVEVKAWKPEPS